MHYTLKKTDEIIHLETDKTLRFAHFKNSHKYLFSLNYMESHLQE